MIFMGTIALLVEVHQEWVMVMVEVHPVVAEGVALESNHQAEEEVKINTICFRIMLTV